MIEVTALIKDGIRYSSPQPPTESQTAIGASSWTVEKLTEVGLWPKPNLLPFLTENGKGLNHSPSSACLDAVVRRCGDAKNREHVRLPSTEFVLAGHISGFAAYLSTVCPTLTLEILQRPCRSLNEAHHVRLSESGSFQSTSSKFIGLVDVEGRRRKQ